MSFELSSFLKEPQIDELKKTELLEVGQHFKLAVNSSGEIKKVVLAYLVDEEILPKEALERTSSVSGEQKRLEYHEKDKAMQLKLKELEIR